MLRVKRIKGNPRVYALLGTFLQSHTESLLEGEDFLQVSTQRGAVWSTQPEIPNVKHMMRRTYLQNTQLHGLVLSFPWLRLSLTKLPLILYNGNSTTEWKGLVIAALTCHWPAEDEGNNSKPSGVLWQTPARVPKCPEPPAKTSNKTVKDLADDRNAVLLKMYMSRWRQQLHGFTDTKVNDTTVCQRL